jgi:dienelactone hydrolase
MKTLFAALAALVVTSVAPAAAPPGSPLVSRFADDTAKPLGLRDVAVVDRRDGIEIHDVSFVGAAGRIDAYLVVPPGKGPFPAVVWSPGLNGTRDDQTEDAPSLAKLGAASIVLGHHFPPIACASRDVATYVQEVVDLRRAVDVLAARPDVDASRIAFVGFSFGSNLGATLAAAEPRFRALVLQSGMPYFSRWLRSWCAGRLSGKRLDAYVRAMAFADAARYVPHARPAALLIQNGTRDTLRPRAELQILHRVASAPKTTRWYRADHPLDDHARADRDAFLAARLGLPSPGP